MAQVLTIQTAESPATNNGISIFAHLKIDDYEFPQILDIDEFFNALVKAEDGPKPIITCLCGTFSCGGHVIDVTYRDDSTDWAIEGRIYNIARSDLSSMELIWLKTVGCEVPHEIAAKL